MTETLAEEIIAASKGVGQSNSYAVKKKDEIERVAKGNRWDSIISNALVIKQKVIYCVFIMEVYSTSVNSAVFDKLFLILVTFKSFFIFNLQIFSYIISIII